jgi:hypothetical protein
LTRGCTYHFELPASVALTTHGGSLVSPVSVKFRVAEDDRTAAARELSENDPVPDAVRQLSARDGINTPVARALRRYESEFGVPAANLVPGYPRQPALCGTVPIIFYAQSVQGYPVPQYGYAVCAPNGIFRRASGKVTLDLPIFPAPRVSEHDALVAVLETEKVTRVPWIVDPKGNHAPKGILIIAADGNSHPRISDFKLVWHFKFGPDTGIEFVKAADVDSLNGKVVWADSAIIPD